MDRSRYGRSRSREREYNRSSRDVNSNSRTIKRSRSRERKDDYSSRDARDHKERRQRSPERDYRDVSKEINRTMGANYDRARKIARESHNEKSDRESQRHHSHSDRHSSSDHHRHRSNTTESHRSSEKSDRSHSDHHRKHQENAENANDAHLKRSRVEDSREKSDKHSNNRKENSKENSDSNKNEIGNGKVSWDNEVKGDLTPSGENSKADVYDESDLKDIEAFLEFGGAEEEEQLEAERLAAERKKRLDVIANKYKQTTTTAATANVPTSPRTIALQINTAATKAGATETGAPLVSPTIAQKQLQRQQQEQESGEHPEYRRKVSAGRITVPAANTTTTDTTSEESAATTTTESTAEIVTGTAATTISDTTSTTAVATTAAGEQKKVTKVSTLDDLDTFDDLTDEERIFYSQKVAVEEQARLQEHLQQIVQQQLNQQDVSIENLVINDQHSQYNETNNPLSHTAQSSELLNLLEVDEEEDSRLAPGLQIIPPSAVLSEDEEGRHLATERSAIQEEEKNNKSSNFFAFDIFSTSPSDMERLKSAGPGGRKAQKEALGENNMLPNTLQNLAEAEHNPHLQSNWDDGDGYYKARIGELIGDRFHTLGVVGKGVFSTVLKCYDLRVNGLDGSHPTVAIKMIRNNDTMRKAAEKERSILLSILEKDPENKRFIVRLLTHLEYRNHVALVFEYQQMNLREALKKFGKDVGINIGAVRMYGKQLMIALRLLMELKVVHADIKLDNILCSGDLKQVKLCDFGSAFRETDTDNDPTPYLVSRFYRAPEIILGMQYDRAIDMWSVCVCLYELFTGHVMFPGRTNNEMLRLNMAVKGRFPNKLVKQHLRQYEVMSLEPHFDADCRFKQYDVDPLTGKVVMRLIDVGNPTRDLAAVLRGSKAGADDLKLVAALTDLLEKGLTLDPSKRLAVSDALKHPFFLSR